MKKILVLVLLLGLLILLIACSKNNYESSNRFLKDPVKEVTIENLSGPQTVRITDERQIKHIIKILKFNNWEKIKKWNLSLAPNLFVVINKNIIIGLFKGDNYARIEGSNDGYYKIPSNIDKQIIGILNKNK